jgi:gamma-glutamylputrescine oxidase
MFSYWEQQSFSHYHHIIIGAGIVGVSAAIELRAHYPADRILVLERGLLPTGASTRNAGFACMGSATEMLDDLQHLSETDAVNLFATRKLGLEKLRSRLGDDKIGYQTNGSYELISENERAALGQLDYLNQLLQPVTGIPAFTLATEKIPEFGFSKKHTVALIQNTCEGGLNSGMMMRSLIDLALTQGIEIKTGADVVGFSEEEKRVLLQVKDPFREEEWQLACNTLSICTNAFTPHLLPGVDVTPGRGQVLITHPVPGLKFKGIYHFDKGYYYFREINGRVLFGGGRNLDFSTETTTSFSLNEIIQADLIQKLQEIILPGTPFTIDSRWTGIMAFGATKQPIVQAFSSRVFGAFRMGGMGVALGSLTASQLATLIASVID